MPEQVTLKVQELTGDQSAEEVYLVAPDAAVGGAETGAVLGGKVLYIAPGLSFFVVTPSVEGAEHEIAVEELEGDAEEGDKYLIVPKAVLGQGVLPGAELQATAYPLSGGDVALVIPLTDGGAIIA